MHLSCRHSEKDVESALSAVEACCLQCEPCAESCLIFKARENIRHFIRNNRQVGCYFIQETFEKDEKAYSRPGLQEAYQRVRELCLKCGEYHIEQCFINNTRMALELLLYRKTLPWDTEPTQIEP